MLCEIVAFQISRWHLYVYVLLCVGCGCQYVCLRVLNQTFYIYAFVEWNSRQLSDFWCRHVVSYIAVSVCVVRVMLLDCYQKDMAPHVYCWFCAPYAEHRVRWKRIDGWLCDVECLRLLLWARCQCQTCVCWTLGAHFTLFVVGSCSHSESSISHRWVDTSLFDAPREWRPCSKELCSPE